MIYQVILARLAYTVITVYTSLLFQSLVNMQQIINYIVIKHLPSVVQKSVPYDQ